MHRDLCLLCDARGSLFIRGRFPPFFYRCDQLRLDQIRLRYAFRSTLFGMNDRELNCFDQFGRRSEPSRRVLG